MYGIYSEGKVKRAALASTGLKVPTTCELANFC
jgi:hypothetical protein